MSEQTYVTEIVPYQQTALSKATSMEATIAAAVEAQSRAMVQARYALAIRNPRDMDLVRQKLLKECKRPGFAEIARYAKKQGKKKDDETGKWVDNYVTGLSIRFAEAALRFYGNILEEEALIHDDADRRVMRVAATDLEVNLSYFADVTILKEVERSNAKGRDIISQRTNSYGEPSYLVKATEDEVLAKQGSLISKALRKQVLRMIPRDLQDECEAQVLATQAATDKKDPDEQRKKVFDAFAAIGIPAAEIKEYLGHDVGLEDLPLLRATLQTLKQGDAKWHELLSEKRAEASAEEAAKTPLQDRLKAKAAEMTAKAEAGKANAEATRKDESAERSTEDHSAALDKWKAEIDSVTDLKGFDEVEAKGMAALPEGARNEWTDICRRRYAKLKQAA